MNKAQEKTLTPFLKRLTAKERFNETDIGRAFELLVTEGTSPIQIAGFLTGLASRGETVNEITGAVKLMRSKSLMMDAPENTVDCCGTGGDNHGTLNISTAVSFVVAGCGVPVAKHGNYAASSKSGAADVLSALGVKVNVDGQINHKALWQNNICFLLATRHHPAVRFVAPVRKELGCRTIFNLLGPMLNPAGVKRQLVGVFDKKWMEPMAKSLKKLGSEHAMIVHGEDGLDEITTTGVTYVTELKDGKIESYDIHPHDVGIGLYTLDDIKGGTPEENAKELRELFEGKHGAYRDIVLFNSAALLMVSGKVKDLKEGMSLAEKSLDDGKALASLDNLIKITNS